jgi:hypothetical protein
MDGRVGRRTDECIDSRTNERTKEVWSICGSQRDLLPATCSFLVSLSFDLEDVEMFLRNVG